MADASLGTATLHARLDASGLKTGLSTAQAETKQAAARIAQDAKINVGVDKSALQTGLADVERTVKTTTAEIGADATIPVGIDPSGVAPAVEDIKADLERLKGEFKLLGSEVQAGVRPVEEYLGALRVQEAELGRHVSTLDRASSEYGEATQQLGKVRAELKRLTPEVKETTEATKELGKTSQETYRGIGAAIGAVAASEGLRRYVAFMRNAAAEANQAATATALFEKAIRRNNESVSEGASMVQRLSDRFGVATSVIEDSATTMLRQGASLEMVEKTLLTAGASAAAAGVDISRSFENVTTAVVSGNSVLLRSSGIIAGLGEAERAYARDLGKTAEQLTDQERIQARVNAIYEETRYEIEDLDQILKGLPRAQAEVTRQWTDFRHTAGDMALKVITPLTQGLGTMLTWFNGLPEPVKQAGIAMAGAAIGATALATGFVAIKAALTGLSGLGLLSFGPAGWVVLGVTAVAGLAVALAAANENSLTNAISKAGKALASGDKDSMVGALDEVIKKVDGPMKTSLEGLREDLVQTGDVGVEQAQRILAALAQARVQETVGFLGLRFGRDAQLQGQISSAGAVMGNFGLRNDISAALASGDVEKAVGLLNDAAEALRGIGWGESRVRALTEFIEEVGNIPTFQFTPPPAGGTPTGSLSGAASAGPAGTASDPVAVSVVDEPGRPRGASVLAAMDRAEVGGPGAGMQTGMTAEAIAEGLRAAKVRLGPVATEWADYLAAELERERTRFYGLAGYGLMAADRNAMQLDGPGMQPRSPLIDTVGITGPMREMVRVSGDVGVALDSLTARFGTHLDAETARQAERMRAMDLTTTNTDRSITKERELAMDRQASAREATGIIRAEQARTQAARFSGENASTYTRQLALQTDVIRLAAREGISLTDAYAQLTAKTRSIADVEGELATAREEMRQAGDAAGRLAAHYLVNALEEELQGMKRPVTPVGLAITPTARIDGLDPKEWDERRKKDEAAAERFHDTVIQAGIGFAGTLANAIQTGDAGGIVSGLAGAAGSIIGAIPGIGTGLTVFSKLLPVFGDLIGGLMGGGNRDAEDRRRREQQQARSVPAITIAFNVQQTNHYAGGPRDVANEQAFSRQADTLFESFYTRVLDPRLSRLERAAGIVGV